MTLDRHSFELYLDDDRYAVPTLHLVSALDLAGAAAIARKLLEESIHHRGVEICRNGQRLDGLGSFATRLLPSDARLATTSRA